MILTLLIAILAITVILAIAYRLFFLRNPERIPPKGNNIVSPADGRIIDIIKVDAEKSNKTTVKKGAGIIKTTAKDVAGKTYLIPIFMSPLNIHYQRAPMDSTVISVRHAKGKFRTANKLALENEKNEILLRTKIGKIKIIQIAGFVVRRTVSFAKRNQELKKGDIIGLVKLGSQVCIILPRKVMLKAKKGDKVYAGETIIADY